VEINHWIPRNGIWRWAEQLSASVAWSWASLSLCARSLLPDVAFRSTRAKWVPCKHSVARPQVWVAVADRRQGVVIRRENVAVGLGLRRIFETTWAWDLRLELPQVCGSGSLFAPKYDIVSGATLAETRAIEAAQSLRSFRGVARKVWLREARR
jgi:hypothetical protein